MDNRRIDNIIMVQGVNPHNNKLINLRHILHILAKNGALSQTDITKHTHLTKQAVSMLVKNLKAAHLIETAVVEDTRNRKVGKPVTLLKIRANSMYSMGFHVKKHTVYGAVYDIDNQCLCIHAVDLNTTDTQSIIRTLCTLYEKLLHDTQIAKRKIIGIGVVLPPYHRLYPTPADPTYPNTWQWQHTIQHGVYAKTHIPVIIENIATALAVKESFFGLAKNVQSFIYIFIEYSVYAGFVHQKKVLSGFEGVGGKFGHLIVEPDGIQCACGNKGCLNKYVSLESLQKYIKTKHGLSVSVEYILENPTDYVHILNAWIGDISEYMRIAIHALETLFNAETIILGGVGDDWFIHQFTRMLRPLLPSVAQFHKRHIPRVINVRQQQNRVVHGASALPFYMGLHFDATYNSMQYHSDDKNTPADRIHALFG